LLVLLPLLLLVPLLLLLLPDVPLLLVLPLVLLPELLLVLPPDVPLDEPLDVPLEDSPLLVPLLVEAVPELVPVLPLLLDDEVPVFSRPPVEELEPHAAAATAAATHVVRRITLLAVGVRIAKLHCVCASASRGGRGA
jgi:hypothetical protein